jgi:hypothetical protein
LLGRDVRIEETVVPDAFEAAVAGDRDRHDAFGGGGDRGPGGSE